LILVENVFGVRLRQARKKLGITQEELAVRAGIDETTASPRISQYENGKHAPSYEIARNLAKALHLEVEYLYAPDDRSAELLWFWSGLKDAQRESLLERVKAEAGI